MIRQALLITRIKSLIGKLEDADLNAEQVEEIESLIGEIEAEITPPKKIEVKLSPPPETRSSSNGITIWSDGACTGNPGPGGWGTIVEIDGERFELSGYSPKSTNNIMEMTGALKGIEMTAEGSTLTVVSDSQYVVKGMSQWLAGWKRKGWKKSDGKEVANKEIWQALDAAAQTRTITWKWVKGHAGHAENERCDQLAREAIEFK